MKQKNAKPKKYRQNRNVTTHFHPRRLARYIVHEQMRMAGSTGANKVAPGTTQSEFAQRWREYAAMLAEN